MEGVFLTESAKFRLKCSIVCIVSLLFTWFEVDVGMVKGFHLITVTFAGVLMLLIPVANIVVNKIEVNESLKKNVGLISSIIAIIIMIFFKVALNHGYMYEKTKFGFYLALVMYILILVSSLHKSIKK